MRISKFDDVADYSCGKRFRFAAIDWIGTRITR
jgi:hypothetical protein